MTVTSNDKRQKFTYHTRILFGIATFMALSACISSMSYGGDVKGVKPDEGNSVNQNAKSIWATEELLKIIDDKLYKRKLKAILTDPFFGAATDYQANPQDDKALGIVRDKIFLSEDAIKTVLTLLSKEYTEETIRIYPYIVHSAVFYFSIKSENNKGLKLALTRAFDNAIKHNEKDALRIDYLYGLHSAVSVLEGYYDANIVDKKTLTTLIEKSLIIVELMRKNKKDSLSIDIATEIDDTLTRLMETAVKFPHFRSESNRLLSNY